MGAASLPGWPENATFTVTLLPSLTQGEGFLPWVMINGAHSLEAGANKCLGMIYSLHVSSLITLQQM